MNEEWHAKMDQLEAELDRVETELHRIDLYTQQLDVDGYNAGYNDGLAAVGQDLQNASSFRIRQMRKIRKITK